MKVTLWTWVRKPEWHATERRRCNDVQQVQYLLPFVRWQAQPDLSALVQSARCLQRETMVSLACLNVPISPHTVNRHAAWHSILTTCNVKSISYAQGKTKPIVMLTSAASARLSHKNKCYEKYCIIAFTCILHHLTRQGRRPAQKSPPT